MGTPRTQLLLANSLIWLPLLLGLFHLSPALLATLALGGIVLSLLVLWVGVIGSIRQGQSAANLPLFAAYGVGATLCLFLARSLSP
ncbi:hypothetical protein [Calidithermus timidus]|jgi:hypothetical protein|uniref:hypothetical protein n=1 Tax=Calidithermus timidus TaxID=307124 RepID=UPI00037955FD|nr:hypothetical protein [Calidithermus timidus]